jgi:hypothetical protein
MEFMMKNLSIAAKILGIGLILSGMMPVPTMSMNNQHAPRKTVWQTLFGPTDAQRRHYRQRLIADVNAFTSALSSIADEEIAGAPTHSAIGFRGARTPSSFHDQERGKIIASIADCEMKAYVGRLLGCVGAVMGASLFVLTGSVSTQTISNEKIAVGVSATLWAAVAVVSVTVCFEQEYEISKLRQHDKNLLRAYNRIVPLDTVHIAKVAKELGIDVTDL